MRCMYNHAPDGYDCFVCNLVAGRPDDNVVVTENEQALATVSSRVWAKGPGHVLVLPKAHIENLYDLDGSGYQEATLEERRAFAATLQAVL